MIELLQTLQAFQNQSYKGFTEGLFFSERRINSLYSRPDDTIFFNISISFILFSLQEKLNAEQNAIAESIIQKTNQLLPRYRNKDHEVSWNFWKTKPSQHFPFGNFAHRFRFFQIPDDIDDSALALIISKASSEMNQQFHEKISRYANGVFKTILYLPSKWSHLPVYNTFFIKNMPCSFDFVALCNLMVWHKMNNRPWTPNDKATREFLNDVLQSAALKNNPQLFAPYYPRLSLIVYHAARLEHFFPGFFSEPAIESLVALMNENHSERKMPMENLLFNIAALKLKAKTQPQPTPHETDFSSFVFFVAGLFEEFSSPWIRILRKLPFTHIHYHCKAMALTLWIEYLVLKENHQPNEI